MCLLDGNSAVDSPDINRQRCSENGASWCINTSESRGPQQPAGRQLATCHTWGRAVLFTIQIHQQQSQHPVEQKCNKHVINSGQHLATCIISGLWIQSSGGFFGGNPLTSHSGICSPYGAERVMERKRVENSCFLDQRHQEG